jgi:hypothetical protein
MVVRIRFVTVLCHSCPQISDLKSESHEMMLLESDESNGANISFRNCDATKRHDVIRDYDGTFTMGI